MPSPLPPPPMPPGVEVTPLKEVLKGLKLNKGLVAVRPLRSPNKPFYAAQLAPLARCCTVRVV
jgi:hypothetical protein